MIKLILYRKLCQGACSWRARLPAGLGIYSLDWLSSPPELVHFSLGGILMYFIVFLHSIIFKEERKLIKQKARKSQIEIKHPRMDTLKRMVFRLTQAILQMEAMLDQFLAEAAKRQEDATKRNHPKPNERII